MDRKLYLNNGYLNVPYILHYNVPFIFVVGGRGTGKTYGALKYVLESGTPFIYMRRTQSQADIISKPEFSPFKTISRDMGIAVTSQPITKYNAAFYLADLDGDKAIPAGPPIGYTMALSTVSNLRGFDASDVEIIIYDEFIPEKHERPLKNEADALFNAYETINRNRELSGRAAVKLLALSNANTLENPIFQKLEIVDKVYKMQKTGQTVTINEARGYAVVMLTGSPISTAKDQTALYKLTRGSDFAAMSIDNSYNIDFERPAVIDLLQYTPVCTVEGITIYQHKSAPRLYVTLHKSGGASEADPRLYKRQYAQKVLDMDARGLVDFESVAVRDRLFSI